MHLTAGPDPAGVGRFVAWCGDRRVKCVRIVPDRGPGELFRELAERLEPLLGDVHSRAEMPFLLAINADPADDLRHPVYAGWLTTTRTRAGPGSCSDPPDHLSRRRSQKAEASRERERPEGSPHCGARHW